MPRTLRHACTYPGCTTLVDRGRCAAHREADRPAYSALYHTPRWKRERRAFLDRHPLCECDDCVASGLVYEATVVDHHIPHGGDEQKFWDQNNWRALAKPHHDAKTARETHAKRAQWR